MFGVLLLDLVAPLRAETVLSVLPVSAGLLESGRSGQDGLSDLSLSSLLLGFCDTVVCWGVFGVGFFVASLCAPSHVTYACSLPLLDLEWPCLHPPPHPSSVSGI